MTDWWASLKHGGLLLSPQRVGEFATGQLPPLALSIAERLRGDILRVQDPDTDGEAATALITTTLEAVCGFNQENEAFWRRGADVEPRFGRRSLTGEMVKPRRVWHGPNRATFPVFVDNEPRLGLGRGRRSVSRVIEWCRGAGHPLALLTNARQFRLLHVGAEHDAWTEWDIGQWFEAGEPGPQLEALRRLLSPANFTPDEPGQPSPLLDAILKSRQGQSQLSATLGERVRQAVEVLIHAHAPFLRQETDLPLAEVYRAGTLVIMRLVVALFAESRDLFPRTNRVYETSYGVNGLWEKLQRAAGGTAARLRHRYSAWPQLLALFRLVHEGSHHPEIPLRRYGGELFRPGKPDAPEPVRRIMHLFETACFRGDPPAMSDADVHLILERLTRCVVVVRQGRSGTRIPMPVDFSDLSTEYIGILYEGLLDYELQQAPENDPILFLNLGDQPALPLSRLEAFEGKALKALFKELGKKNAPALTEDDSEDSEAEAEDEPEAEAEPGEPEDSEDKQSDPSDSSDHSEEPDPTDTTRTRARDWARRAVVEAQLVKAYQGKDPGRRATHEEKLERAANQLLARPPILPGDYFLVRWGGTRKGQGSFYTRPGLVAPTVRRTLAPLCYEPGSTYSEGSAGGSPAPVGGPADGSVPESADTTQSPDTFANIHDLTPKPPAAILALKVCDDAMGSASFLVSALRFLTEALWKSLIHHGWLQERNDRFEVGPALDEGQPDWFRECIRDLPVGLDAAEATIRARLKRVVVERCIYGVDLDPLAVELARLSLWIETMDRDLPFGFLDHKLKCGNALVGCWFDRFQEFPALCLHRPQDDAGDKNHNTAVHCEKASLSTRLKAFRNDQLKPALAHWIEAHDPGVFGFIQSGHTPTDLHTAAVRLFEEMHALPVHETEERARFYRERIQANPDFQQLRVAFDTWCALWFWPATELDHFPLPYGLRRQAKRDAALTANANPPTDPKAPSPQHSADDLSPNLFTSPFPEARAIIRRLRERHRFFHWELEFPDVFTEDGSGFDAMLGNPPWEVQKPNSREWFSNHDPLYRTYGKQEALRRQRELFKLHAALEPDWLDYNASFKALVNWCANVGFPWGDPDDDSQKFSLAGGRANSQLHALWRTRRKKRSGYADPRHPFRHQGSADLNTYKLFLEQTHALLRVPGSAGASPASVGAPADASAAGGDTKGVFGEAPNTTRERACAPQTRMGVIVPSNIYTDKGSTNLRILFLDQCRWEWLFGFENRERLFDIDSRFKFCPLIVAKGGRTDAIRTAFMRRQLADWENAEAHALAYPRAQVAQFSPRSRAILELRSHKDAEILEKMYGNGVLLGDSTTRGWGLSYSREFHMTDDSKLFPPRPRWEELGYVPDAYGHWLKGKWEPSTGTSLRGSILERPTGSILSRDGTLTIDARKIEDVAVPLYEGRMIDHFDFSAKAWVSGKGRSAIWRDVPWEEKRIEPQYLMGMGTLLRSGKTEIGGRVIFMPIGSSTNARTFFSTYLDLFPFGHSITKLSSTRRSETDCLLLPVFLNSFAYDFQLRVRLGGLNISEFVLGETCVPVPAVTRPLEERLLLLAARLSLGGPRFAWLWLQLEGARQRSWHALQAMTRIERLRVSCLADSLAAYLFGLSSQDLAGVLHDCDHPRATVASTDFTRTLDPKGFWRVDKEKDPELRHTVLSMVAFHDLQRLGLDAFLAQNNGEGWMLPETLRLADYGLGHDDRAREHQPVAARLGPRFHPWQLEGTVEESWQECHRHAENLRLIRAHGASASASSEQSTVTGGEEEQPSGKAKTQQDLLRHPIELDLFGEHLPPTR